MSRTDIPFSLTLLEDRDPLTCALYKFMLTPAQGSYLLSIWKTASDAAGLRGFPQLIKSSFTSDFTSIF